MSNKTHTLNTAGTLDVLVGIFRGLVVGVALGAFCYLSQSAQAADVLITGLNINATSAETLSAGADRIKLDTALQPPATNGFLRLIDMPSAETYRLEDSANTNIFVTWENGTGTVWEIAYTSVEDTSILVFESFDGATAADGGGAFRPFEAELINGEFEYYAGSLFAYGTINDIMIQTLDTGWEGAGPIPMICTPIDNEAFDPNTGTVTVSYKVTSTVTTNILYKIPTPTVVDTKIDTKISDAFSAFGPHPVVPEVDFSVVPDYERDPRAMKLYHYGDPDIEITPESYFTFNAGTITGYTGSNPNIVVPYEINGVPVGAIGDRAFDGNNVVKTIKASKTLTTIGNDAFRLSSLTSLVAPSLTSIGKEAFGGSSLTSLVAPALTTLGNYAFNSSSLTAIYYGGNQPTAGIDIYQDTPANLISYVTNPTATGWGDTFGDRPVVRLPLYADEVYSGGSLVATISPSSHWTTNIVASGAQTLKGTWGSQPRLQLSGSTTVDIDWTTYDTNGINRISLTIVSGAHSVIWLTDNIEFATAPELSTTGSSTLLIRKVGTEKAQGRQL